MAIDVTMVRVFADGRGRYGNLLAVVFDGPGDRAERQQMAADLACSETVFVDNPGDGTIDIYTPTSRLEFAGYPLIGTAWALRERSLPFDVLRPPPGCVPVTSDVNMIWIRARTAWLGGRRTQKYDSVDDVNSLPAPPQGDGWLYAWAWSDESAGHIRARGFPRRGDGIIEDEATGAAALALTAELRRDHYICQGLGSRIYTQFCDDDVVALGGRCVRALAPFA